MGRLVQIEPGRWRWYDEKKQIEPARSTLPMPYVISDEMQPTEQVDGRFYTSKRKFRDVGRALGLVEVGTEKFKPRVRATDRKETKQKRRETLKTALEKYQAGHRVGRQK